MRAREDWQGRTGEGWAGEWRRTDRSFGGLTERLLAGTRAFRFRHALDIGCGAGELSLALARGYSHARVVGVDVSPPLLAAARSRGENISNVEFELADAAQWHPADDFTPQLLISRHGVMFFSDPPAAFANLASFAAEHAGLLFSCFRGRSENPVFTEVGSLLPAPPEPADPYAAGPFAFAERDHVSAILTNGGWTNIAFEPFDFAMVTGAGDDPELFPEDRPSRCRLARAGSAAARRDSRRPARDRDRTLPRRGCGVARGDLDRHGPSSLRNRAAGRVV